MRTLFSCDALICSLCVGLFLAAGDDVFVTGIKKLPSGCCLSVLCACISAVSQCILPVDMKNLSLSFSNCEQNSSGGVEVLLAISRMTCPTDPSRKTFARNLHAMDFARCKPVIGKVSGLLLKIAGSKFLTFMHSQWLLCKLFCPKMASLLPSLRFFVKLEFNFEAT